MSLDSHAARVTRRDVDDLAQASELLAVAARTIRDMGPKWGEAVVNLLIVANNTIERMQNKGARAFARYLEKHGMQGAQAGAEIPAPEAETRAEPGVDRESQSEHAIADSTISVDPLLNR